MTVSSAPGNSDTCSGSTLIQAAPDAERLEVELVDDGPVVADAQLGADLAAGVDDERGTIE